MWLVVMVSTLMIWSQQIGDFHNELFFILLVLSDCSN